MENSTTSRLLRGEKNDYKISALSKGKDSVRSATTLEGKQKVAIKTVCKPHKRSSETNSEDVVAAVRKEIDLLEEVGGHPNIVELIEVLEDKETIYLVFKEYVGDLHTYLCTHGGKIPADDAIDIFSQIAQAVLHCHDKGVAHRDLKLENILYSFEGPDNKIQVYLADFGFATRYKKNELLQKYVGSPYTIAPEIIDRVPYLAQPVDVYALGSIFFTLLTGANPYQGKTLDEVFKNAKKGKLQGYPKEVTSHHKNVIKRMMMVDPDKRMSLEELESAPWKITPDTETKNGITIKRLSFGHIGSRKSPSPGSSPSSSPKSYSPLRHRG